MGGDDGAVAGKGEAERLVEAVHGVGGEHAGTRAAGGAGGVLILVDLGVGGLGVGGEDHGVDQVERLGGAAVLNLARLHGPAGDEDGGNVEAQGGHHHAGGDLVAVGDADQGVGAVGVDHVLDRVGDQFARGQAVQHAVVAHGDAVVDGDGVELLGHAAGAGDLAGDQLAEVLEMDVAGNELGEGIGDGDDGLTEIAILHSGGAPQTARSGHVAAVGGGS